MASRVILSDVFSKPPTIPFRIVACTFSDKLSPNSCILVKRCSLKKLSNKIVVKSLSKLELIWFLIRIFPVVKNTVWPIRPLIRISTSKEKNRIGFPTFCVPRLCQGKWKWTFGFFSRSKNSRFLDYHSVKKFIKSQEKEKEISKECLLKKFLTLWNYSILHKEKFHRRRWMHASASIRFESRWRTTTKTMTFFDGQS